MKKNFSLLCSALLIVSLLTGCATDKKYTEEEYQANYDTGYQVGYDAGMQEGVARDRAAQVQTMDYETFKTLNEENKFNAVIYVGRAACPYCSLVTDYMRSVTDLPISVFYVSLEPYYNSAAYDAYKTELGIDSVPTFIYYENGEPKFYMESPVPAGYFDASGEARVSAYSQMTETINHFVESCASGEVKSDEESKIRTAEEQKAAVAQAAAEEASASVVE